MLGEFQAVVLGQSRSSTVEEVECCEVCGTALEIFVEITWIDEVPEADSDWRCPVC